MPVATLRPPDGWRLDVSPTARTPGQISRETPMDRGTVEASLLALRDWATENGLRVIPRDYTMVNYAEYLDIYCWTVFGLERSDAPNNESVIAPFPCTSCGQEIRVGQVYCERCDRFVVCDTCHLAGLRLYGTRGQVGNGSCPACSVECATDGCANRMPTADGYDRCPTCDPRGACGHCRQMAPLAQLEEHTHQGNAYLVCPACRPMVCAECDGIFNHTQDRRIGTNTLHICDACAQVYYDRERAQFEKWLPEELPVAGSLLIPGTAVRPIRTISIETEFDGDGVSVGKALCSAGLLPSPERNRYRDQGERGGGYPCLLKSDASVTGGELVTYLMDMDHENHAAAVMRMTEVMRGCREMGMAKFTHRAGGHIHIDMHGMNAQDLWAKYTLFKYLETPIFFLAGAGADYGHRSLMGSDYCNPGPDGPFESVGQFARNILRPNGGRWALHFGNFNYARESCQCGSIITGKWEQCQCNLGKATAEWRVWNAEVNPRILHGWIALMQALTAYAQDLEGFVEADYPAYPWPEKAFDRLTAGQKDLLKQRLEWMHRELPLTIHERDSLIYAAKKSQLIGLGETYLDSLLDIQAENAFGTKKPARNPNTRKATNFALVGAAVGDVGYVDDFYQGEDEEDFDPDDEEW